MWRNHLLELKGYPLSSFFILTIQKTFKNGTASAFT